MIPWVDLAILAACLVGNAAYSGSETALYTVSRLRVDVEARHGKRSARIIQRLLADDVSQIIVLVLGVNLCVEVMTFRAEGLAVMLGLPGAAVEILLALVLTPVVFFFGDLVPKDLFRRRPYAFLSITAPLIFVTRIVFWPVERVLWIVSTLVTRALRLEPRMLAVVRGREAVLNLLRESTQTGAILPHAEQLARNILKLRSIEVERAMVPWRNVVQLSSTSSEEELFTAVSRSSFTRLPVVDESGRVLGYVHQLDVLGAGPETRVLDHLRPVIELAAHTPVDRALARLRTGGQRLALVGGRDQPLGLLTLKDLVEEISGDLAGW